MHLRSVTLCWACMHYLLLHCLRFVTVVTAATGHMLCYSKAVLGLGLHLVLGALHLECGYCCASVGSALNALKVMPVGGTTQATISH
jgi:hypothetical protein